MSAGAGRLDGEAVLAHVDDLRTKHVRDLDDLVATLRWCVDLEQHELAIDRLARVEVLDLDDVDELVQLLGDLLERRVGRAHHDA